MFAVKFLALIVSGQTASTFALNTCNWIRKFTSFHCVTHEHNMWTRNWQNMTCVLSWTPRKYTQFWILTNMKLLRFQQIGSFPTVWIVWHLHAYFARGCKFYIHIKHISCWLISLWLYLLTVKWLLQYLRYWTRLYIKVINEI